MRAYRISFIPIVDSWGYQLKHLSSQVLEQQSFRYEAEDVFFAIHPRTESLMVGLSLIGLGGELALYPSKHILYVGHGSYQVKALNFYPTWSDQDIVEIKGKLQGVVYPDQGIFHLWHSEQGVRCQLIFAPKLLDALA